MVDNSAATSRDGRTIHVQGDAKVSVNAIKTVLATMDYAANDVISDGSIWTFENMAAIEGGSGQIEKSLCLCQSTQVTHSMRLYLFNSDSLTATLTDNAANTAPAIADYSKALGYINYPALSTKGGATESLVTPGEGKLPLSFVCAKGSRHLYGILITLDAITAEVADHQYAIAHEVRQD